MWQEATPECKAKMLANLDRSGKGAAATSKQVECIETGIVYKSTREAERQTGIAHNGIALTCTGKRKSAGGFHWRYTK